MATYTLAQLKEEIEEAIVAILNGAQSMTVQGRTYTRASLDALRKLRTEIKNEITTESAQSSSGGRSGLRTLAEF